VSLRRQTVHVATMLAVADLGRSVAFYRDRLGFEAREEQAGLALLAHGPMLLYLVADSPPTPDKPGVWLSPPVPGERTPVNLVFRVGDCQAVHAALRAAGVEFLAPPQAPPWGGWRCFGRDPDGYLFEIEQP
jgi:catechol 2,3-dioxygenase-like lactoylglutathione lyase family enzyme